MKQYQATVERDGRFWAIEVRGVGPTQARHLREVEPMARDLIALMTETNPDSFELQVDYVLPPAACEHIKRAKELRAEAEQARSVAAAEVQAAARELSEDGIPLRDIGKLLDLSYQRVHQLVH
jgi:hypothetical protein